MSFSRISRRRFASKAAVAIFCLLLNIPFVMADNDPAASLQPPLELFNGKDLSGWAVEGTQTFQDGDKQKPVWTVKDGIIQCAGKGFGFLRYDTQFCDFEYQLEFRLTAGCNSGVGIRSVKFTGDANTRPSRSGYEIQLLDDGKKSPSTKSTGSLYRYVAPSSIPLKPVGEWNKIAIECRGPNIKITLNDKIVQDVDQSKIAAIAKKPLCGYVSVQNHGGKASFRNLRLMPIK